jgi:hypothetical protein
VLAHRGKTADDAEARPITCSGATARSKRRKHPAAFGRKKPKPIAADTGAGPMRPARKAYAFGPPSPCTRRSVPK